MKIRLATLKDLPRIQEIRDEASVRLKQLGIDQWQHGLPSRADFQSDFDRNQLYVVEERENVIAMAAIVMGDDPNYATIQGKWLTTGSYLTVHRIAVAECSLKLGVASMLLTFAETLAKERNIPSIRIDTHRDNRLAQRTFLKAGYHRCGEIMLLNHQGDARRNAYEKII